MKHGKPQKNLGLYNVRLSVMSRIEGRMDRTEIRRHRRLSIFHIRDNGHWRIRPLSLYSPMNRTRQKSIKFGKYLYFADTNNRLKAAGINSVKPADCYMSKLSYKGNFCGICIATLCLTLRFLPYLGTPPLQTSPSSLWILRCQLLPSHCLQALSFHSTIRYQI